MTWPQAKIEALRLVEEIAARHGKPAEIQLTVYPCQAVYRQQKPSEQWPWGFHTLVARSTYRELLKRGYKAKLVTYEPWHYQHLPSFRDVPRRIDRIEGKAASETLEKGQTESH